MKQTLNSLLEQLNLIVSGIRNHSEDLSSVGVNEETATRLEERKTKLERLNAEQEELKSQLKEKTVELQTEIDKSLKDYAETRKLVKIKAKKVNWRAFGIEDKR